MGGTTTSLAAREPEMTLLILHFFDRRKPPQRSARHTTTREASTLDDANFGPDPTWDPFQLLVRTVVCSFPLFHRRELGRRRFPHSSLITGCIQGRKLRFWVTRWQGNGLVRWAWFLERGLRVITDLFLHSVGILRELLRPRTRSPIAASIPVKCFWDTISEMGLCREPLLMRSLIFRGWFTALFLD